MRPAKRLQIVRQLGGTSLMFLVHPTIPERDIMDASRTVENLLNVATVQLSEAIAS
jgi:hypothetical protein